MAKRFTDSRKWFDPWFRGLPGEYQHLWLYILDSCDHSGIWKVDFELAGFCMKFEITVEDAIRHFGDRINVVDEDKWFIKKFIDFQYGELNINHRLHACIIKDLRTLGVKIPSLRRVSTGSRKGIDRCKDKDKESNSNTKTISIANELYAVWNMIDGVQKCADPKTWSPNRGKSFKSRLNEPFFRDNWRRAVGVVAEDEFFTGKREGSRGFFNANIEWFLRPGKVNDLMERVLKPTNGSDVDDLCEQVNASAAEYKARR